MRADRWSSTTQGSASGRGYLVRFHGLERPLPVLVNGESVRVSRLEGKGVALSAGAAWSEDERVLAVSVASSPVERAILVAVPAQ